VASETIVIEFASQGCGESAQWNCALSYNLRGIFPPHEPFKVLMHSHVGLHIRIWSES